MEEHLMEELLMERLEEADRLFWNIADMIFDAWVADTKTDHEERYEKAVDVMLKEREKVEIDIHDNMSRDEILDAFTIYLKGILAMANELKKVKEVETV